jgi:hypothetical protein
MAANGDSQSATTAPAAEPRNQERTMSFKGELVYRVALYTSLVVLTTILAWALAGLSLQVPVVLA